MSANADGYSGVYAATWLNIFGHILVYFFAIYMGVSMIFVVDNLFWRIVATLVIMASLLFLVSRETYLPFLGTTVFPSSLLGADRGPAAGATAPLEFSVPIDGAKEGARVIYWAAAPDTKIVPNPYDAYGAFENAGVATVKNGAVSLKLHCPASYKVPSGKVLKRHVHYRVCCEQRGMLGKVRTAFVSC